MQQTKSAAPKNPALGRPPPPLLHEYLRIIFMLKDSVRNSPLSVHSNLIHQVLPMIFYLFIVFILYYIHIRTQERQQNCNKMKRFTSVMVRVQVIERRKHQVKKRIPEFTRGNTEAGSSRVYQREMNN